MKLIVGIDFGTSTTVVRYRMENSNEIKSLLDANGINEIIPSVIYRNSNYGITEYGVQALMSAINDQDGNGMPITNFKMNLLDACKREQAKNLIEEFLRYIHDLFTEQTRGLYFTSTEINISYPAKWDETMVETMKQAVANAGFEGQIRGRKEPEAATRNMLNDHLHHLRDRGLLGVNKSLRIFMLDMGAGTTDISIFKLTIDDEGVPRITELLSYPSKEERILCGGKEIDLALRNHLLKYCEDAGLNYFDSNAITLHNVKEWKETQVSDSLKDELRPSLLPEAGLILSFHGRNDMINNFSFDRLDFEQATKDHWKKLYSLIKSAMSQYKYASPEDIDFVCLTGGHSAWYTVPKLFNGEGVCNYIAKEGKDPDALNFRKLKEEPWRLNAIFDSKPQESVARGLCLMDQRIIYETPSANNVWTRITIDNVPGEIIQVVNKFDDILPVKKDVSHNVNLSRNAVFGNLNIEMQIDIYTGETLENAEHRTLKLNQAAGNLLSRILIAILGALVFNYNSDIPTTVSMGIAMTEEGLIEIDGRFTIWDNSTITFTYNDLQLI
jgi:hypothetical protein